jgi:hypothetical protein
MLNDSLWKFHKLQELQVYINFVLHTLPYKLRPISQTAYSLPIL